MTIIIILFCVAIQSVLPAPVVDDLIVSLPDGKVRGVTYISANNKTYYGFQGIPYATPPVDDLRFEAPKPAEPWTEVWDATKDGKSCISFLHAATFLFESEDCLHISVFTPSLKPEKKLPVMLWIYGGKFVLGSSRISVYSPDFLVEQDVIYVSFNYRLGPLGFLSTGDSVIPGNAGLKDQALAIKWTYDNVAFFGGDPDKITIFGESAGGASTGLQLLNKKNDGFYRAAIVQSGSALTNWTIDLNPRRYADVLTAKLGGEMYLNDSKQIKKFLQEKSAMEISIASELLGSTGNKKVSGVADLIPKNIPWPVIEVENENSFLTESPYELVSSGRFNQVPIIFGICANEASTFLSDLKTIEEMALDYDTKPETIIPLNLRQNSSDNEKVIKKIKSLYLKEGELFSSNHLALTKFGTDNSFAKGVIKQAELSSKYVPVYLYQFAYNGRVIFPSVIPGAEKAGHGAELPFLFKFYNFGTTDPADMLTQNRIVTLWANFAKYLNPTPEKTELVDVIWPTITANKLQFLNINASLEVRPSLRDTYKDWSSIYKTYGKKPLLTF